MAKDKKKKKKEKKLNPKKTEKAKKSKKTKVKKIKAKKEVKILDVNLKLRVGRKNDFIELDKYLESGKKKWKMREGIPYWCINSKGEVENDPYILSEDTDKSQFAELLVREQILIPVRRFD